MFHLSEISSRWYQEPEHESGSSSLFVTATVIVRHLPPLFAAVRRAVRCCCRWCRRVYSGEVRVRCASRSATHPCKSRPQKPPHAPPLSGDLQARVHHAPPSRCLNRAAPPSFVSPEPPGLISAFGSLFRWPYLEPRVSSQKLSFFYGYYGWNVSLSISYSDYYLCETELEKLLLLVSFGGVVVSWSRISWSSWKRGLYYFRGRET